MTAFFQKGSDSGIFFVLFNFYNRSISSCILWQPSLQFKTPPIFVSSINLSSLYLVGKKTLQWSKHQEMLEILTRSDSSGEERMQLALQIIDSWSYTTWKQSLWSICPCWSSRLTESVPIAHTWPICLQTVPIHVLVHASFKCCNCIHLISFFDNSFHIHQLCIQVKGKRGWWGDVDWKMVRKRPNTKRQKLWDKEIRPEMWRQRRNYRWKCQGKGETG